MTGGAQVCEAAASSTSAGEEGPLLDALIGLPRAAEATRSLRRAIFKHHEPNIRGDIWNVMRALVNSDRTIWPVQPYMNPSLFQHIKDLRVSAGMEFTSTKVQQAFQSLSARRDADPILDDQQYEDPRYPRWTLCQAQVCIVASTQEIAPGRNPDQTSITSRSDTSADSPERAEQLSHLEGEKPYYRFFTIIVDIKTYHPFRQLLRLICQLHQAYEQCGCRLGIALHRSAFARIIVLDERTILIETSDPKLFHKRLTVADLGGRAVRAASVYPNQMRKLTEMRMSMRMAEAELFQRFVMCGVGMLKGVPQRDGPRIEHMRDKGRRIWDRLLANTDFTVLERAEILSDRDGEQYAASGVRHATPKVTKRPGSPIAEPDAKRCATGSPKSRSPVLSGSGRHSAGIEHIDRKTDDPTWASVQERSSNRSDTAISESESDGDSETDYNWKVEDDRSPISLMTPYRILQHLGIELLCVSGDVMSEVVDDLLVDLGVDITSCSQEDVESD